MACNVTVLAGPHGSGKSPRLLDRYCGLLATGPPGLAIWLSPTFRAAAELRAGLIAGTDYGCLSPGVMTFDQFAEAVLQFAPASVRPVGRLVKRQIVRQAIQRHRSQGRLEHFGPIAQAGGLVDLVCELISELKRLEIWPEHFQRACDGREITQKDIELVEIYGEYQRCLREHQLYDAEGRFWSARDHLARGQRRPFDRVRLVVADGFTDFTRTQHEILEILAGRVEELVITLPLESEPRRTELFAKPLKTLAELRRRHPHLVLEELARPEHPAWPAMAHLERTLFANPRHTPPAEYTTGLEVLAAAHQLAEIELIACRIKELLTVGDPQLGGRPVAPGEIAVVFRSVDEAASLVVEVFRALGIPFALESGHPLDRSPALAALVALLRLDLDDWPFAQLLQVLSSGYFQPDWPEWQDRHSQAAAEQVIRRLQIPRRREGLLEQLRTGTDLPTCEDHWAARVRLTSALLRRLAGAFDQLPEAAGPAGWANAWDRLARETGLLHAIGLGGDQRFAGQDASGAPPRGSTYRARFPLPDELAWDHLQGALHAIDALSGWLGQPPPQWDRRQARDELLDLLSSEQLGRHDDESGRVRVLSAASARALQVPYLFLAGLSEKAFPRPQREDRLYNEDEYRRLIREGLPLVARADRSREEMLLFYETVTRATRRLYLSYPCLDESAQPLLPSPYLSEVEQACGGQIPRTELTDLSPIPRDEPLSAAEFRVQALATALGGDGSESLLAGLLQREPDVAENVLAGLELIELRRDLRLGPAEGMIPGEAARGALSARFPIDHTFSVTELEQYASCPYRYFLDRVLRLKPIEELALAVDYLQRGRLAHEVLAALHRRVNQTLGRPGSPTELDPADYGRLLGETLEETFGPPLDNPVQAALREIDRRLLGQWIAAYRGQHESYDALWQECQRPLVPEFFEVSFGRTPGVEDPSSIAQALEFLAGGQTIRVSGRIDRVDTGQVAGVTVFNVLDYKTGSPVKFDEESVRAGTTLQLPLYALAVAELLLSDRDSVPWRAGYWYLKQRGFKPALTMYEHSGGAVGPSSRWEEMRGGLAKTVAALTEGIRGGDFPVFSRDAQCTGRCPFATICRITQVRSLEKTWHPADPKA